MRVAVLGLGEAGSLMASDLAEAGAEVHGYDPAEIPTPPGVRRHSDPDVAVSGADLVMAVTAAADAPMALTQVSGALSTRSLYADLATASPSSKVRLAELAANSGVEFADVALMAPVPGRGLSTPSLVSGGGATRYAEAVGPLGARVEVLEGPPGAAAGRKLTRSIVTKGLAALIIEALETADARGDQEWMWSHLVDLLTSIDEPFLERLISGTAKHAARRLDEMETVARYMADLAVSPHMTAATVERLRLHGAGGAGR